MRKSMRYSYLLLLMVSIVKATIINVPADQPTIQAGIDAAINGDTVLVQPGTYVENINFNGKNIVISSLFLTTGDTSSISQTIIDGNSNGTVVWFNNGEDSSAVLSGFTIQNGMAHKGGGINFYGEVSPIIQHCIIQNNIAEQRYLENGFGGGIYCNNGPDPIFIKCIIRNNIAESYEGMGGQGGGAYIRNNFGDIGNPRFIKTLIYGNIADSGTSIYSWGGGLYFFNSIPEILNCTISNNMAGFGGGIEVARSEVHLVNSILWGNSNDQIDIDQTDPDSGLVAFSNVQGGEAGVTGYILWLEGNRNADPLFVDTAIGDYRLQEGSPCIDAGTTLFIWNGDTLLDFSPEEYAGSTPDMGAFEYGAIAIIDNSVVVPTYFQLYPNYPNPFNPFTTISYQLPELSFVNLSIYNITGQLVETLVNRKVQPGYHNIIWNSTDVGSGVYFYKIVAGEYSATDKCLLLK